jgi:hypothetical protein
MILENPPKVLRILEESGEINDELDFAIMNYLIKNRGTGFTACQPKLVELEDSKKAIKMDIDRTFIDENNKLMGLGIVGNIFIEFDTLKVLYCTSNVELSRNIKKLQDAKIIHQPRPRGKY